MAVTVTANGGTTRRKTFTIIATADADTTATVAHNLNKPETQCFVVPEPRLSQGLTALSAWTWAWTDDNTLTGTKLTSTSSGNAAVQMRVTIIAPHSIID